MSYVRAAVGDIFNAPLDQQMIAGQAAADANKAVAAAQAAQDAAAAQQKAAYESKSGQFNFSKMLPLLAGAAAITLFLVMRKR